MKPSKIIYCHCAYAQVVSKETKEAVLRRLAESGRSFEAVADLCEMSARRDPALKRLACGGEDEDLKVAACYPRAVKWLFAAAGAPLAHDQVEVINMRETPPAEACAALDSPVSPNVPAGKETVGTEAEENPSS